MKSPLGFDKARLVFLLGGWSKKREIEHFIMTIFRRRVMVMNAPTEKRVRIPFSQQASEEPVLLVDRNCIYDGDDHTSDDKLGCSPGKDQRGALNEPFISVQMLQIFPYFLCDSADFKTFVEISNSF